MIREALQYIAELKEAATTPILQKINGETYCNRELVKYGEEKYAERIKATTLTALLDYLKHYQTEMRKEMVIQVMSPTKVVLYSGLDAQRKREYLFEVSADIPRFAFDQWYDQERFVIELQANFKETEDLKTVRKVAGNVESNTTENYGDDGVSQKTTIKQGIASKADVIVPNPVLLKPYRTFLEVEQPQSNFIFRIQGGEGKPTFKLIEANGGLWKNQAMTQIKEYLQQEIQQNTPLKHPIAVIA